MRKGTVKRLIAAQNAVQEYKVSGTVGDVGRASILRDGLAATCRERIIWFALAALGKCGEQTHGTTFYSIGQ